MPRKQSATPASRAGARCCVSGCSNHTLQNPGLSWHAFPKDRRLRSIWTKRVNRQGTGARFSLWKQSCSSRICGIHFNSSGRWKYEDKLPRFFPSRTYPLQLASATQPRKQHNMQQGQPTVHQLAEHVPEVCAFVTINNTKSGPAVTSTMPDGPPVSDNSNLTATGIKCHFSSAQVFPFHSLVAVLVHHKNETGLVGLQCLTHAVICHVFKVFHLSDHSYVAGETPNDALQIKTTWLEEMAILVEQLQGALQKERQENEKLRLELQYVRRRCAQEQQLRLQDKSGTNEKFLLKVLMQNEKQLCFYTGFSTADKLMTFHRFVKSGYDKVAAAKKKTGCPQSLAFDEQLLLALSRLRVGLLEENLAFRLGIDVSTVSRTWVWWMNFLDTYLQQIPFWPSRALVTESMPASFQELYPSTRVILDCTEIFIETPSELRVQSSTYSSYKLHNTAKGLIGISPNGFVSFVSDLAPGQMSDKALTKRSGLYKLLDRADSVNADRGFLIKEDLAEVGATLNIPLFLNGKPQLSLQEEDETRRIAKLRKLQIHVDRVIAEVKRFRILKYVFPNSMNWTLNHTWKVCAYLCNFINDTVLERGQTLTV